MAQRQKETASQIGNLYDQQYNSQATQLKTAYDKSLSDAQAAQRKIAPQYQTQANQLATQYERNRRNANVNAMASGLGSGTALQQQEALNNSYLKNYATLRGQEAQAQTQAQQGIADLGSAYRQNLSTAMADAQNKKAAALIEDRNKQNDWYDTQAKLLAGYGDFSGYEKLYGTEAANGMKDIWIAQNPEIALSAGLIDAEKYQQMTGHAPGILI